MAGGYGNIAAGNKSFAIGNQAFALDHGAFVWADSLDLPFFSDTTNQFAVRATGGFNLVTSVDSNGIPTTGAVLPGGSGSWSSLSDRNAKINIQSVEPKEVLAGVISLPISTWSYTAQGADVRHMGPMAQDFAAAFDLGENETTIGVVDADGVSLAAIQGMYQLVQEQQSLIEQQQAQIEALTQRLEALEAASE